MSTFHVIKRQRFTTIDRETLNDDRLTFKARGILAWLLDKPDDWRCSYKEIQEAGGEGKEAVLSGLRELEQFGYLKRERYQDAAGHWNTATSVYERPPSSGFPAVGRPAPGEPESGEPEPLTKTVTEDCDRTPLVPTPIKPLEVTDGRFEMFWKMYPRKTKKPVAQKAFDRLMKTVDHEDILAGLVPWVDYWRERGDGQFIPYPATFLNGHQWNDDPKVNGHQSREERVVAMAERLKSKGVR